eukprot:TRINITY_DN436_c0_g1_i1.p1 TRINITY_DN436_c0_g1~~TRINITY_DN436_c0_g1_i1.p1  ORF type:complete len:792 (+),score=115.46 TRINITY_DN436_c0_g1_i1:55-2430(+)
MGFCLLLLTPAADGYFITESSDGFVISNGQSVIESSTHGNSLCMHLVHFPHVSALYLKPKGNILQVQHLKKKGTSNVRLTLSNKDILGLAADDRYLLIVGKKTLTRVILDSMTCDCPVSIAKGTALPPKLSAHVDPIYEGNKLLLVYQKSFWLLDASDGSCIAKKEMDKNIMMMRMSNNKVFGSTINKLFFLTNSSFNEISVTSTPSASLVVEGDRILIGTVVGLVLCYDMAGGFLYTLNKQKDEGNPMDALIGGGGIHSLLKKGNLIFGGMQDSINVWAYGKRNQRPLKVIDTKGQIARQLSASSNKIFALCGDTSKKEILCLDIESQIQAMLSLDEPSWDQCKNWTLFLPDTTVMSFDSQRQYIGEQIANVTSKLVDLGLSARSFQLLKPVELSGEALASFDGGFQWSNYDVSFSNKTGRWSLTLQNLVKETRVLPLMFAFSYSIGLMTQRQLELKFPVVTVLRVFFIDGSFVDLRSDDLSASNTDFILELGKLVKDCFTDDSDEFHQFVMQQSQFARRNMKLCEDFFTLTVSAKLNKMKKIHVTKVVVQRSEKYATVFDEPQKEPFEDLYGEIYTDAIVFFKYDIQPEVGPTRLKKASSRNQVHLLSVRLSCIAEMNPKFIIIATPQYYFTLWFKTPEIMGEWYTYLRQIYEISGEPAPISTPRSGRAAISEKYKYSQPVDNKMSLVPVPKKKKIKLPAVATMGRSRDNTVPVMEGSVSRFHAKIWVENNVPLIKDLDSAAGTMVNNKKVIAATPLKPGDIITIGEMTKFEFCIKDSKKIFSEITTSI